METSNVLIESPHSTHDNKIVLERMTCDHSRRPQHIDTDKDWWDKKRTKTDHQPTTMKRKSPVDCSMAEELEEEEEGHFSSSEQLLFKSLSDAISEYQEPSEQRRHQGRNSHHDGGLEMVSQLNRRKPRSEEPIIPNKRPRYQRRNSFVIRRDNKNHPFFPPALPNLLEGYDDDEDDDGDSPLNRSRSDFLYSPKPDEMPSDTEDWGNLSYTEWSYKFASMSFESAAS